MPQDIWLDFPKPIEMELFSEIRRIRGRHCIYVCQLNRFGLSGALLFVVYFSDEENKKEGLPFILKIARKDKIAEELKAIKLLRDYISDCHSEIHTFSSDDSMGALLLDHKDPDAPETTKTLADEIWESKRNNFKITFDNDKVSAIIDKVLGNLKGAHISTRSQKGKLRDLYKEYLRDMKGERRIAKILGPCQHREIIEDFVGASIYNPLTLFKNLNMDMELSIAPIHGDLHLDNIVLQDENPKLIDFAWGSENDVLIDYALLEHSIRFQSYPKNVNVTMQLEVDTMLLDYDGADNIIADGELVGYHRLALIVKTIRERARTFCTSESRYLLTQFLLLYGLMAYDEYDQVVAMRALGLIAKRIAEGGEYIN